MFMKTIFCIFAVMEMKLFQGKNTINRRQVHICLSANLYIFSLQLLWRQTQQNKLVLFFYPAIIINFMDTIGTFPRWKCCFNGDIQQENPTVTARGSVCPPVASSLIYQDDSQESDCWWLCVFETEHHFTFYRRCLQFMSETRTIFIASNKHGDSH